jgi:nitrite reductase/ring-hydroxylating ferredoxin subunit
MNNWLDCGEIAYFDKHDRKTVKGAVIFKTPEGFFACENRCPHMGYPMNKGTIRDGVVSCAWHNWQFDLSSGGCYKGACDDLQTYETKVENGQLWLKLTDSSESFDKHSQRLIEGMRASDPFLQAKAISLLQKSTGDIKEIAAVAIKQAFHHSEMNHMNVQAIYEIQAIADAMQLAEGFSQRQRIAILLQGIQTAAGSSGDRMQVRALPETSLTPEKLAKMLHRYAWDSSALALERLLISSKGQGKLKEAEKILAGIAVAPYFVNIRQAMICLSAVIHYGDLVDLTVYKPALYAWTLGIPRQEASIEQKDAIQWLTEHADAITNEAFLDNSQKVDTEAVQSLVSSNDLLQNFNALLDMLKSGYSFESMLNSFSVIAARRFSRLPVNNGGMWNSASEGIRYASSLRRLVEKCDGPYKFKALFHLAFYFFETRWIKFSGPWQGELHNEINWPEFKEKFNDANVKQASSLALAGVPLDENWQNEFILPLLEEDHSPIQLNTLTACLEEMKHQDEWQHYISGMVTYAIDQKLGQNVKSAAKFGRSYL